MFTNKHVVVAMLVTPVLAITGWLAIDYLLAERPHPAKPGSAYLLVAKPNCRYDSGQCDLKNGDFEVTLWPTGNNASTITLNLNSNHPLQQATAGFLDDGVERQSANMEEMSPAATHWATTMAPPAGDESTLRIAVIARNVTYYAEVPAVFINNGR